MRQPFQQREDAETMPVNTAGLFLRRLSAQCIAPVDPSANASSSDASDRQGKVDESAPYSPNVESSGGAACDELDVFENGQNDAPRSGQKANT